MAAPVGLVASTLAFAGTVTIGAVVSVTVTLNEADRLLPCASLVSHVTVVAPNGNIAPLAGEQLTATLPSRTSVAVALKVYAAPVAPVASTVASAGTVTTGPVVSVTVTVNNADPLLLRASVAVHVTVVAPSGNVDPLAGVQLTATLPSMVSVADAPKVYAAPV